jgi:hypothetical protein
MTTMTAQAKQDTRNAMYATLAKGGTYTHTDEATGITVSVFYVAGGGFARLDTRGPNGVLMPERSGTYQWDYQAIGAAAAVIEWLAQ